MTQALTRTEQVERAIDKTAAGAIGISMTGGLAVRDMAQAMEVAKLMAVSGTAVPNHLRNNPGACLAIAIQGWEWAVNPFAIANKSYVVNDRLAYEASLYHAVVVRRAPIIGRLKIEYRGEGQTRQCKVTAKIRTEDGAPESVDYDSPKIGDIKPQNSPLWKNDPDQQLFYLSVRAFTRRHFPDVMMGVYTADELQDNPDIVVTTAPARGVQAVKAKLAERTTLQACDHATVGTAHYDDKTGFTLDNDAAKAGEHQGSAPAPANPRDELPPQADGRYKDNLTTDTSESQAPQNAAEEQEKAYNSPEPTIAEQLGIQMAEVSDDAGFFAVCLAAARQTHADITLEVVKPAMEQYCKLKMSKKGPPHTLSREGKARLLKELLGGTFKFE